MIDLDRFPHIDMAGRQVIREFEYQVHNNERLTAAEKAWFDAMLTLMCSCYKSYEEAVSMASMQGFRRPDFLGDMMGRPSDDLD
jgi:hypothetical protein